MKDLRKSRAKLRQVVGHKEAEGDAIGSGGARTR